MRAAVASVEQAEGAVGVLINNAGYSQSGAIETVPMEAVRRQFETNVFGLVRLTQLVLPKMRAQRWGRIVNVGSMGGRLTFPGGGYYHATKHALEAISDALRFEVRGFGIDVVLLEPGLITTEFGEAASASIANIADASDVGDAHDDDPYAHFNATVAAVTAGAYEGPMRRLGAGPERVAKVIERAIARRHPPARITVTRRPSSRSPPAACSATARGMRRCAGSFPNRGSERQLRPRASDLEALGVVDAVAAQHAQRRLVADELRDRLPAHPPDDLRERLDDELVGRRDGQAADEVAVDLQVAEGQVLEVLEGAEAGAEVIERDDRSRARARRRRMPSRAPCRRSRRSR